jgi:nanoRNase/pAp phosphatase (c-di-AMP/oligoRNAs hydrolase)
MAVSVRRPDALPEMAATGEQPVPTAAADSRALEPVASVALAGADGLWPSAVATETAAQSTPGQAPLLVGAAGVLAVFVLFFGWRRLTSWRAPGRQLERVLADQSAVALLMHPNPDPDAMACAMGVASIAREAGTETQIYHSGQINHQENRAFQTVLEQEFDHITAAGDIESLPVVLVDHNEPRGFSGCNGIEPLAVVDHHPGGGTGTEFTDVRPSYGACATIITEYLDQLGVDPEQVGENGERLLTARLATGLLYGVQSDTKSLTRGCTPAEFDACQFLFPASDQELLDRIANPPVSEDVLDIKARAISNRVVESPFCVSHVGEVSNVDAIPQAADDLSRLEGITAVIVLGQQDGTLHMSGRSRDDRVHMGQVLGEVVEDIPMAGAGGHARMGGGQLSIEHMEGIGPSSGVSESQFIDRLFDGMDGSL